MIFLISEIKKIKMDKIINISDRCHHLKSKRQPSKKIGKQGLNVHVDSTLRLDVTMTT